MVNAPTQKPKNKIPFSWPHSQATAKHGGCDQCPAGKNTTRDSQPRWAHLYRAGWAVANQLGARRRPSWAAAECVVLCSAIPIPGPYFVGWRFDPGTQRHPCIQLQYLGRRGVRDAVF